MNNNEETPDLPLSNDSGENLRMENELMKLKMQAEHGAQSYAADDIDPEMENAFLKNVMAFEQNYANAKPTKVYALLGEPSFKRSDELADDELKEALEELTGLMEEKGMQVYFGDDVDSRTCYQFITEELFDHETTFMPMPGMMTCFDYEEFHPNHKKDIESRAAEFIEAWFKKDIDEKNWALAREFILPDRRILPRAEIAAQCQTIFDGFAVIKDEMFKIIESNFQMDEYSGIGHAGGVVKYDVVLANGEEKRIGGPFMLYMSFDGGWWSIFHVVFPGFTYP